jgi:hypothetical protein
VSAAGIRAPRPARTEVGILRRSLASRTCLPSYSTSRWIRNLDQLRPGLRLASHDGRAIGRSAVSIISVQQFFLTPAEEITDRQPLTPPVEEAAVDRAQNRYAPHATALVVNPSSAPPFHSNLQVAARVHQSPACWRLAGGNAITLWRAGYARLLLLPDRAASAFSPSRRSGNAGFSGLAMFWVMHSRIIAAIAVARPLPATWFRSVDRRGRWRSAPSGAHPGELRQPAGQLAQTWFPPPALPHWW